MKVVFFFQAEDGIRNLIVTGVQTCALPIFRMDKTQVQAVILSSPTGSGKTVIIAAALEAIVSGDAERLPNTEATILWLSDSPERSEERRVGKSVDGLVGRIVR